MRQAGKFSALRANGKPVTAALLDRNLDLIGASMSDMIAEYRGQGYVPTFAAARMFTGSAGQTTIIGGRVSARDGGEGPFVFRTGTARDNDGTILAVTGGGYWERIGYKYIDPLWFGCVGDGAADDAANMTRAISVSTTKTPLRLDRMFGIGAAGLIASSLTGCKVVGLGKGTGFKILATPTQLDYLGNSTFFKVLTSTACEFRDFEINLNSKACHGLVFDFSNDCIARRLYIHSHGGGPSYLFAGIHAYGGQRNTYLANDFVSCGFSMYIGHITGSFVYERFAQVVGNRSTGSQRDAFVGCLHDGVISGNTFKDGGLAANVSGIALTGANTANMPNRVVVIGNSCTGFTGHGFQFDIADATGYAKDIAITGNNFCDNDESGMYLYRGNDVTATNNTCQRNVKSGCVIDSGSRISLIGGTYNNNGQCGVFVSSLGTNVYGVSIAGINAHSNTMNGVRVVNVFPAGTDRVDHVVLTGNTCLDNTGEDIFCAPTGAGRMANIIVRDNCIKTLRYDPTVGGTCTGNSVGHADGKMSTPITSVAAIGLADGDFARLTGTTTIDFISISQRNAGARYTFSVVSGLTFNHNTAAPAAGYASILCRTGAPTFAPAGSLVSFVFDGTNWLDA